MQRSIQGRARDGKFKNKIKNYSPQKPLTGWLLVFQHFDLNYDDESMCICYLYYPCIYVVKFLYSIKCYILIFDNTIY